MSLDHDSQVVLEGAPLLTAEPDQVEPGCELDSITSDERASLQKQLDAQYTELNHLRSELDLVKGFLQTTCTSRGHITGDVGGAKVKQIEELRRDPSAAPQSNGPRIPREAQLPRRRATAFGGEAEVKTQQYETTIQTDQLVATETQQPIPIKHVQELQLKADAAAAQYAELQDRYNSQLQELASARNQVQALTSSNQEKDHLILSLTTQCDVQASANATKTKQIAELQQEFTYSTSQLIELQDRYRLLMGELESVSGKAQTNVSGEDKERQVTVLMDEIKRLKSELSGILDRLRNVQRIISTADLYADETVISMLNRLNAEVQQNTTYMAEVMARDFQLRATEATEEQISAASKSIGQGLADCMARVKCDDVELYLPIAFQAYFSRYLRNIISSWTIEKANNDFIDGIYDGLQKAEVQAMSGRWRALTRSYIPSTWINNPSSLVEQIVAELSDIVVAAGCAGSAAAARSRLSSFGDKVLSILSVAGQLSEMIGKVVSADLAVIAPPPLQTFEENTMEQDVDDYDKDQEKANRSVAGQKVLCSTYLGMTKRMQREPGKKETLTVIKAKVVLESFLDS